MLLTRKLRNPAFALISLAIFALFPAISRAQAALLMEEPYGVFGSLNPTGHSAIYFRRICAETPVKLRRCQTGEQGVVLSRYQGINHYDWVAIPLLPYLYSVEKTSEVPASVNRKVVTRLRNRYHEAHLLSLGEGLSPGNFWHGGWAQLVGLSYERRIFCFRFETTEEQDDALIALLNEKPNRSHFYLLFNNCADFARAILNFYFPGTFKRAVFPDAGMNSPKQVVYKLVRYADKHPEIHLSIFEIPQIPGYRRHSRKNKNIAESLTTTYGIPIVLLNPYIAGGIFVDYIARGRHHLIPKNPVQLAPDNLFALTAPARSAENPDSAAVQAPSAVASGPAEAGGAGTTNSGLKEIKVAHE
jgi:hypothetical protein